MQQIAVRSMQFYQIEDCLTSINNSLTKIIHDTGNFLRFQRPWCSRIDVSRFSVFIT